MIKSVNFTLKDLPGQPLSAVVTGYTVWMKDANGVETVKQDVQAGASASFDLVDGNYTAHVQAHAADGTSVGGEAISDLVTIVTEQTITVQVPDVVTVA
jgi:hypothetical protein